MKIFIRALVTALAVLTVASSASADWRQIQKDIDRELSHLVIGAHEVEYSYASGRITLSGFVASENDRALVERTIRSVDGVEEVENSLIVKRGTARPDSSVARGIRARLSGVEGLGHYEVEIEDVDGVITLHGSTENERDRSRIEQVATTTPGVASVRNMLSVRSGLTDESIVQNVRSALLAESDVSLDGVTIRASSGVVTIQGTKSNHREIDRILSIALMADGVRDVRSEMTIEK